MTTPKPWFRTAVAVALSLSLLHAQSGSKEPTSSPPAVLESKERPVVAVLGASVSAGFVAPLARKDGERNSSVKLARAIASLWPTDTVDLRDHSDTVLFLDPVTSGGRQIDRAIESDPALVIAVDFPFWFGYGKGRTLAARKAYQDLCFRLLEKLLAERAVPILIGDYPDMHGADEEMLPPELIPAVSDLVVLNARLHEFVAKHPTVILFPLSDFVASARGQGIQAEFDGHEHVLMPDLLMQSDRLHASRCGVSVLTRLLAECLRGALDEKNPLRPRLPAFAELADDLGATMEIEDWIDAHPESVVKKGGEKREPEVSGKRG